MNARIRVMSSASKTNRGCPALSVFRLFVVAAALAENTCVAANTIASPHVALRFVFIALPIQVQPSPARECSDLIRHRRFPVPHLSMTAFSDVEGCKTLATYFEGAGMKIFCPTFIFSGTNPGLAFRIWSTDTLIPFSRYA